VCESARAQAGVRTGSATNDWSHSGVIAITLALLAFSALISAAALAYPGGTWTEPTREGFSFWHNFWCDLLSTTAIDGRPNVAGALLARLAFVCFAFALYRFWPVAAVHAPRRAPTVRRAGRLGALALLAVAVVPSSTSELLHGIAVVSSAGAQVIAVALLIAPLLARRERASALLALATLSIALLCLAQYVRQGCFETGAAPWLAGMQKVTTLFLLGFMGRVLLRAGGKEATLRE
jgi:hypothetical protein